MGKTSLKRIIKSNLSDGGVPAGTGLVLILMINDCDDIIVIGMLAI